MAQGVGFVAASAIASLMIGLAVGSQPLLWTLSLSLLLGFAYSTDVSGFPTQTHVDKIRSK
jgi:hypothetical protein